jgi:muconolactone delta-isomerase
MECLVGFKVDVPGGTPESEVDDRQKAEASAAAKLADDGHLVRVWKVAPAAGGPPVLGLYRADSEAQLDDLLRALPLYEWTRVTVTRLQPHPNDPAGARGEQPPS